MHIVPFFITVISFLVLVFFVARKIMSYFEFSYHGDKVLIHILAQIAGFVFILIFLLSFFGLQKIGEKEYENAYVASVSKQGIFVKTIEIELIIGESDKNFVTRRISMPWSTKSNEWFSLNGKNVDVKLDVWICSPISQGSSNEIVTDFSESKK